MIIVGGPGPGGKGGKGGQGSKGGQGGPPPGAQGQGQGQGQGQNPGRQAQGRSQPQPGGPGRPQGPGGPGGPGGGPYNSLGGLLNGQQVSAKAKAALRENAADYTWAAAAIGSQNAASYQLATRLPVMPIGGFNGSDPSPTLEQFKEYVRQGKIHYFVGGGAGGGFFGANGAQKSASSDITSWVEKNFKKVTIGSTTLYDLTKPAS
ncbi:putative glycosyltransferase [Streptomyces paromomycinus]|uniref:Putative glycosyltransferase n=2 Tax=Streptomyces paromomycinus TaxID=92743 RepID=A0A401W4P4_STREY|nr:putative glycosyltransferase [Streptomyces paromomycinus]